MQASSNTVWRNFPCVYILAWDVFQDSDGETHRNKDLWVTRCPLECRRYIRMSSWKQQFPPSVLNLWHSKAVRLNCISARHVTTVLRKQMRRSFGKRNVRKLLRWFEQCDVTQIIWFVISAEEYTWFLTHAILHDKAYLRKLITFDVSFVLGAAVTQVTVAAICVAYVLKRFGHCFEYHSGHVY